MQTEEAKHAGRKLGITVPADLHRRAKSALAFQGLTFQEVCEGPLIAVLTAYATGKKHAAETATVRSTRRPRIRGSNAPD